MGSSAVAILLVPHSVALSRLQFSQSECTVTLVLCRLKWLGSAQIQVPFSAMEIICQRCTAMADQIPQPKCVWRSIPSSALLWWPPKNTSYLFSHAVFCQRHLSQTYLCDFWTICISSFNNAVVGSLFSTSPIQRRRQAVENRGWWVLFYQTRNKEIMKSSVLKKTLFFLTELPLLSENALCIFPR